MNKIITYSKVGYHYYKNRRLTNKSIKDGVMYTGPWTTYLNITNHCNLKCVQCPPEVSIQAKKEKVSNNLTVEEYYNLIDHLVDSGCLRIGLTGGEPLIFMEKTLKILKKINERAYSQIVTNGSLINKDFLYSYNKAGGGHITISIDGLNKSHDKTRRKIGLFEKLERIFDLFDTNEYKNIMLKSTFTLFNDNVEELIPAANYFIKRKIPFFIGPYEYTARKLSLIENRKNPFWIQQDREDILKDSLKELILLKREFPQFIVNSVPHLLGIEDYFLRPDKKLNSHEKCLIGYRTVHISPTGEVSTCMGNTGSIKNNSLFDIWNSQEFHKIRQRQLNCRQNCMVGCVVDHSYFDLFRIVLHQLFNKN